MDRIILDEKWTFRRGLLDSIGILDSDPGEIVNLPHDGMINTAPTPDAPARSDMGYFIGGLTNYTKFVEIPAEWENDCVGLAFDGIMLNASIDINGYKVASQHYGYAPFYVDISDYVTFGAENRITINVNTSMQPNSRWYTGSGMFRGAVLTHGPKVHLANDGIYVYTKEVAEDRAFLEAEVDVCNASGQKRIARVELSLYEDGDDVCSTPKASISRVIHIEAGTVNTARMAFNIVAPKLWNVDSPNLYKVKATVTNLGVYRTHLVEDTKENQTVDESYTLFGIRTISVDSIRGLRINGKMVKLKGGCLHHDNGLLGAVSLYETEARKVKKLKEIGFNAIRTAHNPPSAALIEACDRLGMFVFDEAFDAWGIAKRGGDYSQFFDAYWKKDLTAFVKRDRIHPSVIIWSIGNEIPERGGLNNGYTIATNLANTIHSLDTIRPVSNGICSFWAGLDDEFAKGQSQEQNSNVASDPLLWEKGTEPFTNGLDIVGYNYMEVVYERDHEMYPERVILGSENFPQEIGFRWPLVEARPYVIGDFTWTAWDYLGEAGIGKSVYVDPDDPLVEKGPWALMPPDTSPYPWRTANDADYDITGRIRPQGDYRKVVWGSTNTYLYSVHPKNHGKTEVMSMWGFTDVLKSWNYAEYENQPVGLLVFSGADEVEILINGESIGRKPVDTERPLPGSVRFDTIYKSGKVEAISYKDGVEISRDHLITSKEPAKLVLAPEKNKLKADGHDLVYVNIEVVDENSILVPDCSIDLTAECEGEAVLAGFGSGNPITDEDYTDAEASCYKGCATAILRSGYTKGNVRLTIKAQGLPSAEVSFNID